MDDPPLNLVMDPRDDGTVLGMRGTYLYRCDDAIQFPAEAIHFSRRQFA